MSIHVALNHLSHYKYDRLVTLSPQIVRLRPAPHSRTRILSYSSRIDPAGHFLNWQQDPQSNYLARLVFPEQVSELRIEIDLIAELSVYTRSTSSSSRWRSIFRSSTRRRRLKS